MGGVADEEAQSLRDFLREELLLHRKHLEANIAALEAMSTRIAAGTAELRKHTRRMNRDHEEFHAEMRASREAMFRMLDGYGEGGTSPAA
jgi:predicted  nucleic acid-binding Zn-ribbon protein